MIILLSPAKKQDVTASSLTEQLTKPLLQKEVTVLIDELKQLSKSKLKQLMSVSDAIAELNYQRFNAFNPKSYNLSNSKPAVATFKGDAYRALDIDSLNKSAITFLQEHLVILSGLYGCLRPLDLIQPYRLEMKTRLKNNRGADLYTFWGDIISKQLTKLLKNQTNKTVINLASGEYFKAIKPATDLSIITMHFKEKKGDTFKTIGIHAKRARGLMTRFIAINKIKKPEALKKFNEENYCYSEKLSSANEWVFIR